MRIRSVETHSVGLPFKDRYVTATGSLDRREMAILRSLGAGPRRVAALLVLESGLLAVLGTLAGLGLTYLLLAVGQGAAERHFGIHIPIVAPGRVEWLYLAGVVVAGVLVGLLPAWRAYRNALQDGLAIRL